MYPQYLIHPSLGVARVGNAEAFYLAPDTEGGLPLACDEHGNVAANPAIKKFKAGGKIVRQAAKFSVYRYDSEDADPVEITLSDVSVERMKWTVHVANKKPAWYAFRQLQGNLLLGAANTYPGGTIRNSDVPPHQRRDQLITDPGPRTVEGSQAVAHFSRPATNKGFSKYPITFGTQVDTLGDLRTDKAGRLVFVPGYGAAGGWAPLSPYDDSDNWFDDIADGPVLCELKLKGIAKPLVLDAWCMAVPPNYAPEIVNIVTLDDLMFDVAVSHFKVLPGIAQPDFQASLDDDVRPLISRMARYDWVANVPQTIAFGNPRFDPSDASAANAPNRQRYASQFRSPQNSNELNGPNGTPAMPLLAGDNTSNDTLPSKFATLTATQYRLLEQWANGFFVTGGKRKIAGVSPIDRAAVANCVGGPLSPGIEVTWSLLNPAIYSAPWRIKHRDPKTYKNGLSLTRDETEGGGCEPGDLTKRMAIPWQSDLFGCTTQAVSFSGPNVDVTNTPPPPTFFAYWWPAHVPVTVLAGERTAGGQNASSIPEGMQVSFARGINSGGDMVLGWSYLGFVVNQNKGAGANDYPYFAEVERNHDRFVASAVAVGHPFNLIAATDGNFVPMFFLKEHMKP